MSIDNTTKSTSDIKIKKLKKQMVVKIIIPVVLVCIVAGIWFMKNSNKDTDLPESKAPVASETGKSGSPSTNKFDSTDNDRAGTVTTKESDFELHVTEKIDLEKLKSYGLPIIIDFGADSCLPCKEMAPVLKELNAELQGKAIVKFVDVWKYQSFADGYPVSVIPTQIFIDSNGNPYKPKDPEAMQMQMYELKSTGEHVFTAHQGGMTKEQILSVLKEMGLK